VKGFLSRDFIRNLSQRRSFML